MGRKINMKTLQLVLFGMAVVAIKAQDPDFDFVGSNFKFKCPEPNGLFADPEQCDLYYVCEDNIATPELCEDGLLLTILGETRRNANFHIPWIVEKENLFKNLKRELILVVQELMVFLTTKIP